MRSFVFIDTNILLHYQFFRDVDWAKELHAREAVLVFAPVVVEELDRRKWDGTRRDRARAKKVLKALKNLRLSPTPVAIRRGVKIMALDEEPADDLFARHRLRLRVSDDRLLASVLAFEEAQSGAAISVLTADMGLSLRASTRQIAVVEPDERLQMDDEPDEAEREIETLQRQLAAIQAAKPDLKLTLGGEKFLEYEVRRFGEFSTDTIERMLGEWRTRHPHIRMKSDSNMMPVGIRSPLNRLLDFPGSLSKGYAIERNVEIDFLYEEYEAFLRCWPASLNAMSRCLKFQFVLQNSGTEPADDVDVLISTIADGKWIEESPKVPKALGMQEPRDPFAFGIIPQPVYSDLSSVRLREDSMDGPNILKGNPPRVRYSVRRVMHHVPCDLPVVYFQLASDEDVRSFTLTYRLVAANIREPQRNDLHVKLTVSKPIEPPSP